MLKDKEVQSISCGKTPQEFYECANDSCPLCGKKYIVPCSVFKLGNIVYHLNCYVNSGGKI